MAHNHKIIKCSVCTTIISQCRCMSKDKVTELIVCDACKIAAHDKPSGVKCIDPEVLKRLERVKTAIMTAGALSLKEDDCNEVELLALLSLCVGECIAMQNKETMTIEVANKIIQENIQLGNENAIRQLGQA